MNYSELLTYLINITGMKLKDVASLVNYDISYISKWTNGHNLPTLVQNEHICKILAENFANSIYANNLEANIRNLFDLNSEISSKNILQKKIYSALITAYFHSTERTNSFSDSDEFVLAGWENIKNFIYYIFSMPFSDEKTILYSTLNIDFLKLLLGFDSNFVLFSNQKSVEFNFIVDTVGEFMHFDNPFNSFKLLSEGLFYDFNAYRNKFVCGDLAQFIYIKDKFVLFFNMDTDKKPVLLSFSKNKKTLELVQAIVDKVFVAENIFTKTVDNYSYPDAFFRNNLFPENVFYSLFSFSDGYFLSDSMLERLLNKSKISDFEKDMLRKLLKMQRYSVENLSNYVTFNMGSYFRFMKERKISLGHYTFELNDKEFDLYMKNAFNIIQSRPNHTYYLINSHSVFSKNWDYPINLFITDNCFISKKPVLYNNSVYKYLVSSDAEFIAASKKLFFSIGESFFVQKTDNIAILNQLIANYNALKLLNE